MILDENDKLKMIAYRMEQARDTLEDVKLLIENDRYRAAVNRVYYGMFYALLALGLANGFESSKHTQLIGWFNKNFIHPGLINIEYGKIVNKAFNRRVKGDYDMYIEFDESSLVEMNKELELFIAEIQRFLNI